MGDIVGFFSNLFGYLLNFIYDLIGNYGLAIIVFSIIIKIILIPLSIKQQKSLKKSAKMQGEMKKIQEKYKGDTEKLNQETMAFYKREKMNPFSGCFSAIIQLVLLFAIFYLVRSPLTFMKKVAPEKIENYVQQIKEELPEGNKSLAYPEITVIKEKGSEDTEVSINMEFLGLDLSSVPTKDVGDFRVYIIPVLYVISSFISMRITTNVTQQKKKEEDKKEATELDAVAQANKNMAWFMPIMSITIAMMAPLGLALYWLTNNILMTGEKLILNHFIKDEDEKEEEAHV